jgi:hypothetical protein
MKRAFLLSLIVSLTIGCFAQANNSPLVGAWKLVYGKWGAVEFTGKGNFIFNQTKVWLQDYISFLGEYGLGTPAISKQYGTSTYKIVGNGYEEIGICGSAKDFVGEKTKMLFEIKNDTLIQRWPADDNWKLKEGYNIEKYVRLK